MNWKIIEGKLTKEFEFNNFIEAVLFINKIVPLAEKAEHHPDVCVYSYNKVRITLLSHDKGEVTDKDYKLAEAINSI
jgi:4a-hydroxytetrahydrobiopterin dehydratase